MAKTPWLVAGAAAAWWESFSSRGRPRLHQHPTRGPASRCESPRRFSNPRNPGALEAYAARAKRLPRSMGVLPLRLLEALRPPLAAHLLRVDARGLLRHLHG